MRRGGRLLALALAGGLMLSGCRAPAPTDTPTPTPSPTPAAVVPEEEPTQFALGCYPGGLHPITGSNRIDLTLAPLLYRGLFALDRGFVPHQELCDHYEVSGDGLKWTFWLAEATFSDGSPVTAREAAASLNAARKSDRYGQRLSDVTKVTAVDTGRIEVTLSRPNGALPSLLEIPIIKETEDKGRPLGTGPYYLTETEEGLFLTAREGAQVPMETIPLRTVASGDELIHAFDAREISVVDTDLTGTNMPGYSGRVETIDYPTTTLLYVGCNTASGPCKEAAVRRAMARAFDREELVQRILLGHAVPTALPVHPDSADYQDVGIAYDRDKALELLSAGGWSLNEEGRLVKGREELVLRLIVNQENTYKVSMAEALRASLEALGCRVTLEKLPWDSFVTALEKGEFDLYLAESILTADFDVERLVGPGGALNYGRYQDKEKQKAKEETGDTEEGQSRSRLTRTEVLLNAYRAARGEERRAAALELWTWLEQEGPIISLCFKNGSLLTQWGQVTGAAPTQRDVFAGLEDWVIR